MKHLLVQDWMSTKVITISPDAKLPDAAALMEENNIRRLPVIDATGELVGIISQTDVLAAKPSDATSLDVWEINYLLSRLRIDKVMTPNPLSVRASNTIQDAAQLMYTHKIGGLPVVDDDNHVVGIITESDIFRILIAWFNEEIEPDSAATSTG